MVKANSKAQGVLSLIPLPKIAFTYHYPTSGYHNTLSPEAQNISAFVTPIGKFEFKKVPLGLSQMPMHFQQVINEALKSLSFASGYLDDIAIFCGAVEKHFEHLRNSIE